MRIVSVKVPVPRLAVRIWKRQLGPPPSRTDDHLKSGSSGLALSFRSRLGMSRSPRVSSESPTISGGSTSPPSRFDVPQNTLSFSGDELPPFSVTYGVGTGSPL